MYSDVFFLVVLGLFSSYARTLKYKMLKQLHFVSFLSSFWHYL